jgi:hypothetical protein
MKLRTAHGGLAGFKEATKTEAAENSRALCFQKIIISRESIKGKWKFPLDIR